jgi:carbonic anhydrase
MLKCVKFRCRFANNKMSAAAMFLSFLFLLFLSPASANWDAWWTYDGISGPSYWGVINPAWTMCSKGRQQGQNLPKLTEGLAPNENKYSTLHPA